MAAGLEPCDQAGIGVRSRRNVWTRHLGGMQQGIVGPWPHPGLPSHRVTFGSAPLRPASRAGHRHRRAQTWRPRENTCGAPALVTVRQAGGPKEAGNQNDGRRSSAMTFEIHFAEPPPMSTRPAKSSDLCESAAHTCAARPVLRSAATRTGRQTSRSSGRFRFMLEMILDLFDEQAPSLMLLAAGGLLHGDLEIAKLVLDLLPGQHMHAAR
jgi:hypothetical protein